MTKQKNTRRVQLTCVLTIDDGDGRISQRAIAREIRDVLVTPHYLAGAICKVASVSLVELDEAPFGGKKK